MDSRPLYIIGAGGFGKEVASLVIDINRNRPTWEIRGFLDDNTNKKEWCGFPVLGTTELIPKISDQSAFVLALGDPVFKRRIARLHPDLYSPVLVHPSVTMNPDGVMLGSGTILCAGVRLTTDIVLGEHVLVNLNATIGHDCRIGSYCSLMPGVNIAGGVQMEEAVLVGSGANVLNGVHIGSEATVGSGAVVVHPVDEGAVVVGIPAKQLHQA